MTNTHTDHATCDICSNQCGLKTKFNFHRKQQLTGQTRSTANWHSTVDRRLSHTSQLCSIHAIYSDNNTHLIAFLIQDNLAMQAPEKQTFLEIMCTSLQTDNHASTS